MHIISRGSFPNLSAFIYPRDSYSEMEKQKNDCNLNYSRPISEYPEAEGESKHIHADFVDIGKNNHNNNKEGRVVVVGGWEAKGRNMIMWRNNDPDAQQLFP